MSASEEKKTRRSIATINKLIMKYIHNFMHNIYIYIIAGDFPCM